MIAYLPYLLKVGEVLDETFDRVEPYIHKGYGKYLEARKKLDPYNPEALIKMFTGFSMMFFGGFFISTVAVFEAVNQGGFDRLAKNLGILRAQYRKVQIANDADDRLDEDNDGIADVTQISAEKLTFRKILVVLRACNPEAMTEALSALYTVMLAVVATLRVKFARTVSLGASIGEMLAKPALKFVIPILEDLLPDEFDGWVRPVALYVCRALGVSLAFSLQRVLSTVHTAFRGANMLTEGFTSFAESRRMDYLTDGYADDAFSFAMAFIGIYAQLLVWKELPVVMQLVLFPAFAMENVLSTFISFTV